MSFASQAREEIAQHSLQLQKDCCVRAAAYGMRLAIPAGSTIRWAPGEERTVRLQPFRGARVAYGFSGLVNGPLDEPGAREAALARAAERGYRGAAS